MPLVLIVDDAAFMRMRCARLLKESGYEVIEAANGADAVRIYGEAKPDAVLMDITMPEMDGLTALKEIRKADPSAKIAMLTAMGQQTLVVDALKSGAKDFVLKPFQPDRIVSTLRKMIG